jgi:hypothetical protein
MDDRRAKPRLSVNLEAIWDGVTGNHPARITNLSAGGCYLDTVGEAMSGEIVCFRVLLPDDDWLYLEGEVRHNTRGLGFGVRFSDLNDDQEEKIARLLNNARLDGTEANPIIASLVED